MLNLTAKIAVERGNFDADFSNLAKTGGQLCLPLNLTRKSGRLAFRRPNNGHKRNFKRIYLIKIQNDLSCSAATRARLSASIKAKADLIIALAWMGKF